MNFETLLNQIQSAYAKVPSLACSGCKGECCVSPTMTAAEFILMMNYIQTNWEEKDWIALFNQASLEHKHWHGNSYCRFQDQNDGRCIVYPGRAMACRLHGHNALKKFATKDSVFCEYEPDQDQALTLELLEELLDPVRGGVNEIGSPSEAPFYFVSLNLESWLDFYFHPEYAKDRPQLEKCWMDLRRWIKIDKCSDLKRTTLDGKLNTIEHAFQNLIDGELEKAKSLFQSLQSDFPSVGTYFVAEANAWEAECEDMLKEKN